MSRFIVRSRKTRPKKASQWPKSFARYCGSITGGTRGSRAGDRAPGTRATSRRTRRARTRVNRQIGGLKVKQRGWTIRMSAWRRFLRSAARLIASCAHGVMPGVAPRSTWPGRDPSNRSARRTTVSQSKFGVAQESTEAHTVTGAAESERAEVRETMVLLSAARRWRVMAGRRVIPISSPLPGQPEGAAPFEQRECPRKDAEHRSGGD